MVPRSVRSFEGGPVETMARKGVFQSAAPPQTPGRALDPYWEGGRGPVAGVPISTGWDWTPVSSEACWEGQSGSGAGERYSPATARIGYTERVLTLLVHHAASSHRASPLRCRVVG